MNNCTTTSAVDGGTAAVPRARVLQRGGSRKGRGGAGTRGHKAILARKCAGKWTDGDRDLAEREMAVVIVERQQVNRGVLETFQQAQGSEGGL